MDLVFGIIFAVLCLTTKPVNTTNDVVILTGNQQVMCMLAEFNEENNTEIKPVNTLGNFGRYKNIGIEYEYKKNGTYTRQMKKANIKIYKSDNIELLYYGGSEITPAFVGYVTQQTNHNI